MRWVPSVVSVTIREVSLFIMSTGFYDGHAPRDKRQFRCPHAHVGPDPDHPNKLPTILCELTCKMCVAARSISRKSIPWAATLGIQCKRCPGYPTFAEVKV